MKKRKGFTLIELLVVIAIIALLLSIMMPSLARAKALAERVICMTNMKNIGYALIMYADANNGNSVWAVYGGSTVPDYMHGLRGSAVLDQYMGITAEDRVNFHNSPWVCRTALKWSKRSPNFKPRLGTTYAWNGYAIPYSAWEPGWTDVKDVKLSRIKYTSQCLYIGDAHWWEEQYQWTELIDALYWATPEMLHLGGANFAFFDGHGEYRKEEDVPVGCEPGDGNFILTAREAMKDKFWWPYGLKSRPNYW